MMSGETAQGKNLSQL